MNIAERTYKVMISGGGTGGHLFPGIAIAKAIEQQLQGEKVELLFIGAKDKIETQLVPKEGYILKTLSVVGLPRNRNIFQLLQFVFATLKALFVVKKWIKEFKPDAIIGVGGYASFPTVYMGQKMRIPTFIQEQNAYVGVVNKTLAPRCTCFFGAHEHIKNLPDCNFIYTGNPVRKIIQDIEKINPIDAREKLNLAIHKKVILILGGSQGSKKINEAIVDALPFFIENEIQLVWQTGTSMFRQVKMSLQKQESSSIHIYDFIREMDVAYAASDIIISRAGASSITEFCVVAKPCILIPLPTAAEDHQTFNAKILEEKGAAIHIPEKDIKVKLCSSIQHIIGNDALQNKMSIALRSLSIKDADQRIAKIIIEKMKSYAA